MHCLSGRPMYLAKEVQLTMANPKLTDPGESRNLPDGGRFASNRAKVKPGLVAAMELASKQMQPELSKNSSLDVNWLSQRPRIVKISQKKGTWALGVSSSKTCHQRQRNVLWHENCHIYTTRANFVEYVFQTLGSQKSRCQPSIRSTVTHWRSKHHQVCSQWETSAVPMNSWQLDSQMGLAVIKVGGITAAQGGWQHILIILLYIKYLYLLIHFTHAFPSSL